jgi:hypothetical protein
VRAQDAFEPRDSVRFSITAADWPAVRLRLDELSRRYQLT